MYYDLCKLTKACFGNITLPWLLSKVKLNLALWKLFLKVCIFRPSIHNCCVNEWPKCMKSLPFFIENSIKNTVFIQYICVPNRETHIKNVRILPQPLLTSRHQTFSLMCLNRPDYVWLKGSNRYLFIVMIACFHFWQHARNSCNISISTKYTAYSIWTHIVLPHLTLFVCMWFPPVPTVTGNVWVNLLSIWS